MWSFSLGSPLQKHPQPPSQTKTVLRPPGCAHVMCYRASSGTKMIITNDELYSEPEKLIPSVADRTINGIYLLNERLDVDNALENRKMRELIDGKVERAVVPVESFYTKRIRILYDVMVKHDLHIIDELFMNISHMLLGLQGTSMDDIGRIVSHPQALLQCQKYIQSKEDKINQIMELQDDAEAARQLAIFRPANTAVISSRRCAYLYNLKVLDEAIQDKESNPTRFVVLSKEQIVPTDVDPLKCKTSIFFALPDDDKPGALSKALGYFSDNNINLIWLDSRKLYPGEMEEWADGLHFLFYANFEGSINEDRVQKALEGLKCIAPFLRVMGSHKLHWKFLEDSP